MQALLSIRASSALALLFVIGLGARASAQNFNIDVGTLTGVPDASLAGPAGQPGTWNGVSSSGATPLVDLLGNPTGATIEPCCSAGSFIGAHTGAITGPDAPLWNDGKLSVKSSGHDWWHIYGVQDGIYDIYAVAHDFNSGGAPEPQNIGGLDSYTPPSSCVGDWPGMHIEGVTYVRHRVAAVDNHVGVRFTDDSPFCYLVGLQVARVSDAGANFCLSSANSTGSAALMSSTGGPSTYFGGVPFSLIAAPVPDNVGIFIYAPATQQVPFGNGTLCLASGGQGIFRFPGGVAQGNVLQHDIFFPGGATQITPGSTWYFQAWFRDPAAGGAGVDLSDGLRVDFVP